MVKCTQFHRAASRLHIVLMAQELVRKLLAADTSDDGMPISITILALTKQMEYSSSAHYLSLQSLEMVAVVITSSSGMKLSVTSAKKFVSPFLKHGLRKPSISALRPDFARKHLK